MKRITSSYAKTVFAVWWRLSVLWIAFCFSVAYAATPAGTVIKNQASASYKDSNGIVRYTTSNIVETLIQQVAALQLTQDQSRPVAAGNQVFLPHTVTNTGNGADSFSLTVENSTSGDDFDLTGLAIYADENQDGQPDIYTQIITTPSIPMQGSWSFVVAGSVPPGSSAGETASLFVSAGSQFNSLLSVTNTDTVSVTNEAVIELTKSISATAGASPDGPFTVSLNYRNTGSGDATDVTIIDALPAGMGYVADSGRWNQTGNEILTDTNPSDIQGGTTGIRYCAYNGSCSGLAEANVDADSDSSNQVTGIVSNVGPGESGRISFQVEILGGLNSASLFNTAEFEYTRGASLSTRYTSNTVTFQILHSTDVVLNGSTAVAVDGTGEPNVIASIPQGSAVYFENIVWNTGNGSDTFDVTVDKIAATFPSGTLYRLLQSDGMTPLMDSTGNGVPDTGPLAVSGFYKVVLQVTPPVVTVGDNAGAGYEVATQAIATTDASKANGMLNRLGTISTASVDVTNVAPMGDPAALGTGQGPEASAVSTLGLAPGTTGMIGLYINNTGPGPISTDLAVSTADDFSVIELPAGWIVTFRADGETDEISNSGVINPGEYLLVNAHVSVPANSADGDVSLYFRALSEVTGAVDIKHDVVTVSTIEQVLLELDQTGQTAPGGSYVYDHLLTNSGNVSIATIQLATSDSLGSGGWSSVIYDDTDGNGQLNGADQVITSIATLAAGEIRRLFVKVFSPSGAAVLSVNHSVLTATWNAGVDSTAVTDATTVAELEITIIKEQAPDLGCDGSVDGTYGVGGFAVEPGNNCVSYRLTATNAGQSTAYNVDVADATPAFTEYFGSASCSHTNCSVSEPSPGGQGNVVASLPTLAAGAILVLEFSVRVE